MMSHTSLYLRGSIGCLPAAAALAGCAKEPGEKGGRIEPAVADLALTGGAIPRSTARSCWAQAIAIDDGRIVYVGTDCRRQELHRPADQSRPAQGTHGRARFPGRAHPPDLGGIEANALRPERGHDGRGLCRDDQEVRRGAHPNDPWITGGGWSMAAFGPGALARKELIDAAGSGPAGDPRQPRWSYVLGKLESARACGHHEGHEGSAGWANRPGSENGRSGRQPPGRRGRCRERHKVPPCSMRSATPDCATRSRC